MNTPRIPRRHIVHFEVATEAQAAELDAAWQKILAGKRIRIGTAAEDTLEIMERAGPALEMIVKAIEDHPGTGQSRPLVHARLLTDAEIKPLCGASDWPWSPRTFEFSRITCWECQAIVLKPADHSE